MQIMMKILPWLAGSTAILHAVFGTAEVHSPLLNSQLSPELRLLLYACWHIVTVVLLGSFALLFVVVYRLNAAAWIVAARCVGALWILSGVVFISVTLLFANPRMLFTLGQWILLIPIGTLALLGPYEGKADSDKPAER